MKRLYIVVREDIHPGLLTAQACHAATHCKKVDPEWEDNLIVLGAKDERELVDLQARLQANGVPVVPFHEPDLNGELTSVCARGDARRYLRHLQPVLREVAVEPAAA